MTASTAKAAIYARCSSGQSSRSIEEQLSICRAHAEREGWSVVDSFSDVAPSGAANERPGLAAMLTQAGELDIMLAETVDRFSRDLEGVAAIRARVDLAACELVTVSEGAISGPPVGITAQDAAKPSGFMSSDDAEAKALVGDPGPKG